jgi:hypothetical protein
VNLEFRSGSLSHRDVMLRALEPADYPVLRQTRTHEFGHAMGLPHTGRHDNRTNADNPAAGPAAMMNDNCITGAASPTLDDWASAMYRSRGWITPDAGFETGGLWGGNFLTQTTFPKEGSKYVSIEPNQTLRQSGASDLSGAGWCGVRVRGWRDRDSKNRWFLRRRVLGVPVGVQPYAHVRAAGRLAGCQGHCGRRPPRWADRGPRRGPPRPGVVCRVRRSGGREGTPGGGAGGSAVLRAAGTAGVA